jgi:DNA-binding NarL/FixJ family response regulator
MTVRKNPSAAKSKASRILLVDDHPMVRERLADIIQREPDMNVVGEAEDRRGALGLTQSTSPHLAIIDLTLKNSSGLELIKDLRAQHPDILILVVSMHDESLHAERVIHAGARGYITKQEATKKILLAIRTVLDGQIFLSDGMSLRLAANLARQKSAFPTPNVQQLTDREMAVFEMIGQGFGTRQIAERLALNMRTVETYRARMKEKLQLKDADELRQYAIRWFQSEN